MIAVRVLDGRSCPVIVCDTCGRPITDPGMAAVVWDMTQQGDRLPSLVHKGACHDALDHGIKGEGGFPGWAELSRWFVDLLHNSGLHGDRLDRAISDAEQWAGVL